MWGGSPGAWRYPTSPDGRYVAILGINNTVQVWTTQGEKVLDVIRWPIADRIPSVAFSPDSELLALPIPWEQGLVKIWNLQGEEVVSVQTGHQSIEQVFFTADGQHIITIASGQPGTLTIDRWNLNGKRVASRQQRQFADGTVISDLGGVTLGNRHANQFVSVSDSTAFVWNIRGQTGTLKGRQGWFLPPDTHRDAVQISADGQRIATLGSDRRVRVWDAHGNQIAEYEGSSMALSADGQSIVVVSRDNTPKRWRIRNLDELIQQTCRWLRPLFMVEESAKNCRICSFK